MKLYLERRQNQRMCSRWRQSDHLSSLTLIGIYNMCSKLFQIYQKRTPTFIAELTTLIAALVLLCDPPIITCPLHSILIPFYWGLLLLSSLQIFFKLIIFAIIYNCNRQFAATFSTILLILFALAHLGVWIFSITLLVREGLQECPVRDRYFLKSYVWGYGIMIVGGIALFILLTIPAVGFTLAAIGGEKERGEEEEIVG